VSITSGQDDEPEGADNDAAGYVVYELNEWSRESREMVQQLLEAEDVAYVWESTNLVVPAPFEERADEVIDQVEVTAAPPLDPDAEKVLYDLGEWTDEEVARLVDALVDAEIGYEFDVDANLVVVADDEPRVDDLFDTLDAAGDAEDEDDDDDAIERRPASDVLSDLFVAADRLSHHARDHEGVLGFVKAAGDLDNLRLPFGFEPEVWTRIVEDTDRLRDAIEGDEVGDDEIEEQAAEYRTLLRRYV
jgi:hypothetical protein